MYQGIFSLGLTRLSPVHPEVGTKGNFSTALYPQVLSIRVISFLISSYLSCFQLTVGSSILLTAITSWPTPRVKARKACSLVCPPGPIPASNSPVFAETNRTAPSAWLDPVIMFFTKSRWPGASMTVKKCLGVSSLKKARSMVRPLSRSSFSLSRTHANLKASLPIFLASSS